jgi:ubiquinone/menaquinone biosynthesis C-methylase UbiE
VAQQYVLGSDADELDRLEAQARSIAAPTEMLLRAAGIEPGMTVLDLGTGLGHVASAIAALVGSDGEVLGIDQDPRMIDAAERRRSAAGLDNVRFRVADVRTFAVEQRFDAVVGRLVLFHLTDPVGVIRHHAGALAPGGRFVAIDFDIGTARSEPPMPLIAAVASWINDAFRAAGANPVIGARLGVMLREAGLDEVSTFGIQSYIASDDPTASAFIAGVVGTLAPTIISQGIATEREVDLDTLRDRLYEELRAADAVVLLPGVVGAWGTAGG